MERKIKVSSSRRKFIRRFGLSLGSVAVAGTASAEIGSPENEAGEKVMLM